MPGMLGDNMFKVPVAYQISKQLGVQVDVVVDEGSHCLCSLLNAQPWVNEAKPTHGVLGHPLGGQPWDFGRDAEWRAAYDQVWHLGFRHFPGTNMIANTRDQCGFQFENPDAVVNERPILGEWKNCTKLALAIESSYPPRAEQTLRTILPIRDQLAEMFDEVHLIAHAWGEGEYGQLLENPKYRLHKDEGDLNLTVNLLDESLLVGTYSSMWAMAAACVKCPQVCIMDSGFFNPLRVTDPQRELLAMVDDGPGILANVQHLIGMWRKTE